MVSAPVLKDLFRMIFGIGLQENMFYDAFFIDKKSGAMDAIKNLSHELLFAPHIVLFDDCFGFVGEETEGQFIFFDEFLVFLFTVGTHTENFNSFLLQHREIVAQAAGLRCTSWGIIFRIKIQHEPFTLIIL